MTTDNTSAEEPRPQYWAMIGNIARQVTDDEAFDDGFDEGSDADRLARAMAELCEIPIAKIQEDVLAERIKLLEIDRQDDEDRYGALNQDGLYPHEVEPD